MNAWYVEYVDDEGLVQLTTYIHCADALKAYYELKRPAVFGLLYCNGRMHALDRKEVADDGET